MLHTFAWFLPGSTSLTYELFTARDSVGTLLLAGPFSQEFGPPETLSTTTVLLHQVFLKLASNRSFNIRSPPPFLRSPELCEHPGRPFLEGDSLPLAPSALIDVREKSRTFWPLTSPLRILRLPYGSGKDVFRITPGHRPPKGKTPVFKSSLLSPSKPMPILLPSYSPSLLFTGFSGMGQA